MNRGGRAGSQLKATILNRIKVGENPGTPEMLRMVDEKFYPPKGWDLKKKPHKPKAETIMPQRS
jgi:hypothetical protein